MRSFRYEIVNKHGETLDLTHKRYMPELAASNRSFNKVDRLTQGGYDLLGDGRVVDRKINLRFSYVGSGDTTQEQVDDVYLQLNTLSSFFRKQDAPFYLYNLERNVRARVYGDFSPKHQEGNEYLILTEGRFQLDMLDNAWEDSTATATATATLDSGDIVDLTLPAYSEDVFPVITLTAKADSETQFSIETGRNDSSGFTPLRAILIIEPLFTTGREIEINAEDGRVYFEGNDKTSSIVGYGVPPHLDRRNESIRYTAHGGTGTVDFSVSYRKRSQHG